MSQELFTMGRPALAAPGVVLFVAGGTSTGGTGGTGGGGTSGGTGSGGTTSSGGGNYGSGSGSSSPGGDSGLGNILVVGGGGQSNANYAANTDGAGAGLATGANFYLGASSTGELPGYDVDGIGLFNLTTPDGNGNYTGSFVANTDATTTLALYNDTRFGNTVAEAADVATLVAEIATAGLGSPGIAYQAYVAGLTSTQLSQVAALFCYWGESDSLQFTPGNKAIYKACVVRWMAEVRAMFGMTAAQLPFLWFGPPYGLFPNLASGPPTIREVWAEIAADPAQNAVWLVQQTYDTISRNDAWSATTGVASGGNTDGGHRSAIDNVALFKRGALATARAIVAAAGLTADMIPAALGSGLGPQITAASLSGTTLTLTITHDGGTDLVVPLLAAQGVGFAVMDGGSTSAPGNIIKATSCARVDATHLTITLASAPTNAHSACRLMYPWAGTYWTAQPDTEIGRGCAVTDNFAAVTKPVGFDINAVLGAGWGANMPLCTPIIVTGSGPSAVGAFGIPLS